MSHPLNKHRTNRISRALNVKKSNASIANISGPKSGGAHGNKNRQFKPSRNNMIDESKPKFLSSTSDKDDDMTKHGFRLKTKANARTSTVHTDPYNIPANARTSTVMRTQNNMTVADLIKSPQDVMIAKINTNLIQLRMDMNYDADTTNTNVPTNIINTINTNVLSLPAILVGKNSPTNQLGKHGNFYVNTTTGHFYSKYGDTWVELGNITDPNIGRLADNANSNASSGGNSEEDYTP